MLSVLQSIKPTIKSLVSGYCRAICDQCDGVFIIDIVQLCTIYYAQSDRFDRDKIYHDMVIDKDELDDDTIIHQKNGGVWATVLGETVVRSDEIYSWTFELMEHPDKISNTWRIVIGIVPNNWEKTTNSSYTFVADHYGFIGASGSTHAKGSRKTYTDTFGNGRGDKITMILDLSEHKLSYIINGKDNDICIRNINTNEYRLAISLCKGRKIQLISSGWYRWPK